MASICIEFLREVVPVKTFALGFLLLSGCATSDDSLDGEQCEHEEDGVLVELTDTDIEILGVFVSRLVQESDIFRGNGSESGQEGYIVLSCQPPLDIQRLEETQILRDYGEPRGSGDILENLYVRNTQEIFSLKRSPYYAFPASEISEDAVVFDEGMPGNIFWSHRKFFERFPGAKGWVEFYLPGYSNDGTSALVRADIGPSVHGAAATMELSFIDGQWRAFSFDVSFYL